MIQDVITVILEDHQSRFLLLRRTPFRGDYPSIWSAISGRVEHNLTPRDQARKEILEETGLEAEMLFEAEPFLLTDPQLRSFRVHPFRYRCLQEKDPALNIENVEFRWVSELPEEETVPALGESLRRAMGGTRQWLSTTTREALLRWKDDQSNGAIDLAIQGAKLLASCVREYPGEELEALVCMIRGLAIKMQEAHPDMAIIPKVFGYVLRGLREGGVEGASRAAQEIEDKLFDARTDASKKAADLFYQLLHQQSRLHKWVSSCWLTLSSSSTVQLAFEVLHQKLQELSFGAPTMRVLESRPLGEGISLAKRLKEKNCEVSLYPDATMLHALNDCQGVLLGADAVFSDGSVRNKIGSALLASVAKQRGIPVYVIAETWKVTAENSGQYKMLSGDTAIPEGQGGLSAWVPLFDVVPTQDITAIITEDGPLDSKRLEKLSERRSMWTKRPFLVWGVDIEEP
jgi:ribose 1,5-bisphosphate isomerase